MIRRTELLPGAKAALVQKHYAEYNVELVGLAVAGADSFKVTIAGQESDVQALFDFVNQ